jgi:hypothetical protein
MGPGFESQRDHKQKSTSQEVGFFCLTAFEIYFKKPEKQKKPKLCVAKWTFVWIEPPFKENELARNPSAP